MAAKTWNWRTAPNTSVGLLILIAVLQVLKSFVHTIFSLFQVVAVLRLVYWWLSAKVVGGRYLGQIANVLLAAADTTDSSMRRPDSAYLAAWAWATRAADVLSYLLSHNTEALDHTADTAGAAIRGVPRISNDVSQTEEPCQTKRHHQPFISRCKTGNALSTGSTQPEADAVM